MLCQEKVYFGGNFCVLILRLGFEYNKTLFKLSVGVKYKFFEAFR